MRASVVVLIDTVASTSVAGECSAVVGAAAECGSKNVLVAAIDVVGAAGDESITDDGQENE